MPDSGETTVKMMDKLGEIGAGDIFGGISSFAGFVSDISAAKEEAAFRDKLLTALQHIQVELHAIKAELDKIDEDLREIKDELKGQDLNPPLRAIKDWAEELAALESTDEKGRVNLANEMLMGKEDMPNIPFAMDTLDDALVGAGVFETPLIELLDLEGILRIRARLLQGLHLLAFICAFNDQQALNFGVYLWQWSGKFRKQAEMILKQPSKCTLIQPETWPGFPLYVADTIAIYEHVQPSLDGVGLYAQVTGQPTLVHSGTLTIGAPSPNTYNPVREPLRRHLRFRDSKPADLKSRFLYVDLEDGEPTATPRAFVVEESSPPIADPPYNLLRVHLDIGPYGEPPNTLANLGSLRAAARGDSDKTFLGAADGQLAWVEDQKPYTGSIFEGESTWSSPVLVYREGDHGKSVMAEDQEALHIDLTKALWTVRWRGKKGTIEIVPFSRQDESAPVALSINKQSDWVLVDENGDSALQIEVDDPTPQRMDNPFKMPPSVATIGTEANPHAKRVVFYSW